MQGNAQFISSAVLEQARHAEYPVQANLPKILSLGCFPAKVPGWPRNPMPGKVEGTTEGGPQNQIESKPRIAAAELD